MRATLALGLLLSGCFDLNALDGQTPSAGADLAVSPSVDLAMGSSPDGSMQPPDLQPAAYWLSAYNGNKPLRAISGSGTLIVAVGDGGTAIVAGGNGGKAFASESTGTGTNFTSVWAIASDDVWIVGKDGGHIYHYDGSQYVNATSIPTMAYAAVAAVNTNQVIAVGDDVNFGGQFKMANMYKWQSTSHNLGAKQHGMWAGTKLIWTVGENTVGGYYDVTAFGWTAQTITGSANNITFNGIWGSSDTDVWAVGAAGNVSHGSSGTFRVVSSNTTRTLHAIWGLSASNIWAVGDAATILNGDERARRVTYSAARSYGSHLLGGRRTWT